jgi:hypothetical protein
LLDYEQALGRDAQGVWPIRDNLVMALSIDPDAEIPAADAQDDYWSLPQTASAVDLVTQEVTPYSGLPADLQMQSAGQHVTDGRSYYQNYRYDAAGNIEVVEVGELTPSGWRKRFELGGSDLWTLKRLR